MREAKNAEKISQLIDMSLGTHSEVLMDEEEDKKRKRLQQMGAYVMVPFIIAVPPILGWFIGKWLDNLLGTQPYLKYILLVLGFISGFREFYRIVKDFGNED